jgi:hypothetical protein
LDEFNGYEMERKTMRASLLEETLLHPLLFLFEMLYTDKKGDFWLYDEHVTLYRTYYSRPGFGRRWVLGTLF